MSAEIRFPTGGESPHYLSAFVFSRGGAAVNIEVVDQRNTQKCVATIPIDQFREAMAFLGCVKEIQTEQTIRVKDFDMGWEQHRYAVERAGRMRREAADRINDHCMVCRRIDVGGKSDCHCPDGPTYAGATLQGEANSSDAEMLEEVADFLRSLEGYDDRKGGIGFLDQPELGTAFVAEWNKAVATVSVFCDKFRIPKPDMIFPAEVQRRMSEIAGERIGAPIIYAGVRVRFGKLTPMDVLVIEP